MGTQTECNLTMCVSAYVRERVFVCKLTICAFEKRFTMVIGRKSPSLTGNIRELLIEHSQKAETSCLKCCVSKMIDFVIY